MDKTLCISDCSRFTNCRLISFNQLDRVCNYYNRNLTDQTNLIQSSGNFLYVKPNFKGTLYKKVQAGCQVMSIIALPNEYIATGCSNNIIKIWNPINWTSILEFNHGSYVLTFAVNQNKYLISGGDSGVMKAWDYKTGTLKSTFSGHTDSVRVLSSLNNDDIVSGSYDNTVKIWNSTDAVCKLTLNVTSKVYGLAQLKNGNLITTSPDGNIRIWNLLTGGLINITKTSISLIAMVKLENEDILLGSNLGEMILHNSELKLKKTLSGHSDFIVRLIQLQNGDLASCSFDNYVKIWDSTNNTMKLTLKAHTSQVWGLIELPNGFLISAGKDSQIFIWK